MMLMGYWSCAVQPGTAMTAHGDDEVRRHKGCRTFLLRPRAPRPSDPELPHAEANLPTRYPTHRKQRGGIIFAAIETGPLQDLGYLRNVVIITGRINGAHELARYVTVN